MASPLDPTIEATIINALDLEATPPGTRRNYWLSLVHNGMGQPIFLPVMVARGRQEGPTVGVTAAVHGNELNGIPIIQRLFRELDPAQLHGTLVGVPVVNAPALLRYQRRFLDGVDLNHIMPGRPDGNVSEVYAYRLVDRIIRHFDYLLDLHTASFGRVNSYYIRADMEMETTRKMALLQNAQIVVHNPPSDGTLRGAAEALGIPAITLEVGDPNTFQRSVIRSGFTGILNLLSELQMLEATIEPAPAPPVICQRSYWIYTDTGGFMTVHPQVTDFVEKDQLLATLRNVFGEIAAQYYAPEAGIVIGKSVSPVNQTGGRILHLGIV
ncbi:MAG: succinylglutamate desuccinylase/aspartoacylase family protein [Lewinella sp.]|nr:succinylglutamate desuccinylase/aspartoacylase family protein [Lewinella sp.]